MKASFLMIALALLAACSDGKPPQQAVATPPAVAKPSAPQRADMAAAEMAKAKQPASDPCNLKGYDMSKMTVELHEQLVKECQKSKR